jgi:hypothetical protein
MDFTWLQGLLDRISTERTIDFVVRPVQEAGGVGGTPAPLVAGSVYLTIAVRSLRLPLVRKGATRYNGLVHAFADIAAMGKGTVQLASATTPAALTGLDATNASRVITIDRRVVGPTPWHGGALRLQLGLFSVVEQDLAGPFLQTLTSISEKAGGGLSTTAKPFLDVVGVAVGAFAAKTGTVRLEVGLDQTFRTPQVGLYAVVAAPSDELNGATLTVDAADGRLLKDGVLYKDRAYMVFTIEASTQQEGWGNIPELQSAYAQVEQAVKANDTAAAKTAMEAFRRTALICPDLIQADAARLIEMVDERLKLIFGRDKISRGPQRRLPKLGSLALYPKAVKRAALPRRPAALPAVKAKPKVAAKKAVARKPAAKKTVAKKAVVKRPAKRKAAGRGRAAR